LQQSGVRLGSCALSDPRPTRRALSIRQPEKRVHHLRQVRLVEPSLGRGIGVLPTSSARWARVGSSRKLAAMTLVWLPKRWSTSASILIAASESPTASKKFSLKPKGRHDRESGSRPRRSCKKTYRRRPSSSRPPSAVRRACGLNAPPALTAAVCPVLRAESHPQSRCGWEP
jgi:hypothetical protein